MEFSSEYFIQKPSFVASSRFVITIYLLFCCKVNILHLQKMVKISVK